MLDPNLSPDHYADAYVHLLLTQEEAAEFEARCESDETFRRALDEARRRKQLLESSPPTEATEELVKQTLAHIDEKVERRRRNWRVYSRWVGGLTAAAVLVIAGFHTYFSVLKPTPFDLRVLGQNQLLSGATAAIRVALFNQQTAAEMQGVPVSLTLVNTETGEAHPLGSYKTGDETPGLQLPDWDDGEYELRVVAKTDGQDEVLTSTVRLARQWQLMLSSDKPMYQPGQTIHLRSLALRRPDLKPVAGEQIVFRVIDPKGNVIFKHQAEGSRFGLASVDCPLATEIIEGDYQITCAIGDVSSEKTVRVEKYVLPKFNIGVQLDKPFYQPGERVEGSLRADYFFGKPVAGGEVKIEVRSVDVQPFTIATIADKTDDAGGVKFDFTLPKQLVGREQDGGNAAFTVLATVTDTAGQSYSNGARRIVTSRPIQLTVIPESGTLIKGVRNVVYIFANYVDGRPAEVDLQLNSKPLTKTNRLGVAEFGFDPSGEPSGLVGMTLVATDAQGRVGRGHATLVAGQAASDFVLRTDKATYRGGETMWLTALGGGVEPVFVDFLKDGQSMRSTTLEMSDGVASAAFDLPPELFGTIKLVAYRFGPEGLPVRKAKTIFVRQARELKIAATLDQDEYRPGESAKLKLKLTDEDGNAVPGAVSLAAVDEAVFALLGQRPGMEEVFFLLEQELLEPVYALYNWDPFDQQEPDEDIVRFEQALFCGTAEYAAGPGALPRVFTDLIGGTEPATEDDTAEAQLSPDVPEGESPFTLAAESYQAKVSRVDELQTRGLRGCNNAWWMLAGVLAFVGWGTAMVAAPRITISGSLAMVLAVTLLIPAVKSAREASQEFDDIADAIGGAPAGAEMAWEADMMLADGAKMAPPTEMALPESDPSKAAPDKGAPAPRVRKWFPETLLWRPQVITDENGEATLEIPLADSITTWRLTTSAVSAGGQLGGGQLPIRVFQPFFVDLDLPVAMTRNDEVGVPVVTYNYLDEPQTVTLQLEAADWFVRLDDDGMPMEGNEPLKLELKPQEIRSLNLPLRIKQVGKHNLQVTATGSTVSDAIRRQIEVVADGRRVEQLVSGTLSQPLEMTLTLPEDHIEGSARAIVKLYPSTFSQLVEGLDAIFQMPYGCFEQTSSTTYPNVLALDYLRRNSKNAPEVEAKARQYIHLGYQRLISFEVDGGGFDWFGNPPANQTLTAYGLMEFQDMANVHDVDPQLIDRTRAWLLSKREADGRWKAEPNMLNDGLAGSVNRGDDLDLAATAYIAWAVFGTGEAASEAQVTLDYLLAHEPASIDSPYLLATLANAVASINADHPALIEYLQRLESMKQSSEDGKQVWWSQADGEQTMFYGDGRSGDIETTALAALALMRTGSHSATVKSALTWLIAQKDSAGTWHSTQATVLALKALVEASGAALGDDKSRTIEIALETGEGEFVRTIEISADQAEVMQQINLSDELRPGEQRLTIIDRSDAGTSYQVIAWHHVEEDADPVDPSAAEPLKITIDYDRQRLKVDETVTATAVVVNQMDTPAPMVILDLPIPGGFKIEPGELQELVGSNKIAKFEITARQAVVYLRGLQPGQQLKLNYRLKATMPVKVTVPAAAAYEYYNPDRRGTSQVAVLEALKK